MITRRSVSWHDLKNIKRIFFKKNDLIKKFECLPSLNQKNVVTLSNIDMNYNVSDVGSNIDDSKKEELEEV